MVTTSEITSLAGLGGRAASAGRSGDRGWGRAWSGSGRYAGSGWSCRAVGAGGRARVGTILQHACWLGDPVGFARSDQSP